MQTSISPSLSHKLANMGFVCACLVVALHVLVLGSPEFIVWWLRPFIADGICDVGVPFFFFASAYFLAGHIHEPGWWHHETKKRVKTLLIPYFAWGALFVLLVLPLILTANKLAGVPWSRNIPLSLSEWLATFGIPPFASVPYLPVLWFVRTLFIFVLCAPLLTYPLRYSKTLGCTWLLLLFVAQGFLPSHSASGLENALLDSWFSLKGLFYFSLGLFLRTQGSTLSVPKWIGTIAPILGLAAFLLHFWAIDNGMGSIWFANTKWIAIPAALIALWTFVPSKPWPRWLTNSAFPIYLMHWTVTSYFDIFFKHLPMRDAIMGVIPTYWVLTAFTVGICLLATLLIRKLVPRIAACLFGGR